MPRSASPADDGPAHRRADRRVVDRLGAVGAEVDRLVAEPRQLRDQVALQLEAGVVRPDRDPHAVRPSAVAASRSGAPATGGPPSGRGARRARRPWPGTARWCRRSGPRRRRRGRARRRAGPCAAVGAEAGQPARRAARRGGAGPTASPSATSSFSVKVFSRKATSETATSRTCSRVIVMMRSAPAEDLVVDLPAAVGAEVEATVGHDLDRVGGGRAARRVQPGGDGPGRDARGWR